MDRRGFTLVEMLVVISIIGVLIAMLLPAVQATREAGRNMTCQSNLRQIAVAMQNYNDANGFLPPAKGPGKKNLTGSFAMLLQYIDMRNEAERYDLRQNYDYGVNLEVSNLRIPLYLCPSMVFHREVPDLDVGEKGAPGSYAVSTGSGYAWYKHDGAIIHPSQGRTNVADISNADGSTNTLLVGEFDFSLEGFNWPVGPRAGTFKGGDTRWAVGYPGVTWGSTYGVFNARKLINNFDEYQTFRSDHPGGANFAFVGGAARFVTEAIDPAVLDALATRAGRETVPADY